jgi:hypothetical protein
VSDRYGQLTYTSFEGTGSAGGWQIKETSGALTDEESRLLVAQVQTVFTAPQPLPPYPTPEQLSELPRRMAYRRILGDTAAFWHSVPAGADATGRPGNVFAHVLLDRDASEPGPACRPIQLWRSPRWLCPFGKAAVGAAKLPLEPPGPGTAVTADTVIAFALDTSTWRLGVLLGLLDAVAAAMGGGPPVLLGVDSADAAAQWIGLISFLMSPGTAQALTFSTFDRADQLTPALSRVQQLTAVPREDLDCAPLGVVAIDDTEMLSLGEFGGEPHRTAAGHTIDVTAWSAMTQVGFLDAESARLLLTDIDTFAAHVSDTKLHPAWPMAMSVLNRPQFSDAAPEARSVIAMNSPRDLPAHSLAGRAVREVVAALAGSSTAEAWRVLQQVPEGPAADAATEIYLHHAIFDGALLDQRDLIPLRDNGFTGQPVPGSLRVAVAEALETALTQNPERLIRLVDLVLRAGLLDDLPPGIEADVALLFSDPTEGSALAQQLGAHIGSHTRLALARAVMRRQHANSAAPLGDAALGWLSNGLNAPPVAQLAAAKPWDDTWVVAALYGARFAQRAEVADAQRFWALWWLRVIGEPATKLTHMAGRQRWDPAELLLATGDASLPVYAAVFTLLGAPPSAALLDLASHAATQHDNTVVACAVLRLRDPAGWAARGSVGFDGEFYGRHWADAVAIVGSDGVDPQVAGRLLVLAALAALDAHPYSRNVHPYPSFIAVLGADSDVSADALAQILDMVDKDVLDGNEVAAGGLLRSLNSDDRESPPRDPADRLLQEAAQQLGAARQWTDDHIHTVVDLMAAMSGRGGDGALRRFRKVAQKMLTGPSEGHSSLAARLRWSR